MFGRFRGLNAVIMNTTTVFWDVTPCSLEDNYQRFGGSSCFRLQGRKIRQEINYRLLAVMLVLLFDTDD
jgi:hypothetical protein